MLKCWIIATFLTGQIWGQTTVNVLDFFNETFCSSCVYNSQVFPRHNQSDPVEVTMTLSLSAVTSFDEVKGRLHMVGELQVGWRDEVFASQYDTAVHNFEDLIIPPNLLWTPTITIFNSVDSASSKLGHSAFKTRVNMTSGEVKWTFSFTSKTRCSVDATNYPFDVQICDVIFTPRGYTFTEIDFNLGNSRISTDDFSENEEWTLTHSQIEKKIVQKHSFLSYKLKFSRKSKYFLVNMALPIWLLAVLNSLVFLLPADTGERVGYSIAAFLTFAVFLSLVSASLPQSSFPVPLISYYMLIMLLISSSVTFVTIFNLRFYFASDPDVAVPKYLKTLVFILFCQCRKTCDIRETKSKLDIECAIDKKATYIGNRKGTPSGTENDSDNSSERAQQTEILYSAINENNVNWKMVGKAIDLLCFITIWLIYISIFLGFFIKISSDT